MIMITQIIKWIPLYRKYCIRFGLLRKPRVITRKTFRKSGDIVVTSTRNFVRVSSRKLIETEYSWFLQQYDAYEYVIQRADSIRYFVLHKYGGIYSDLDIKPKENFVSLYEMYKNSDVALLSNRFIMSKPDSPFWPIVWKHLQNPGKTTWYKPLLAKTPYFKVGAGIISDAAKESTNISEIPSQLILDKTVNDVTNNTQWILLGFVIAFAFVIVVLLIKIKNMGNQGNQSQQSNQSPRKKTRRKTTWD